LKATEEPQIIGESLWLDHISRDLLKNGTFKRYIEELSVTGLTSNTCILGEDIKNSSVYDGDIRKKLKLDQPEEKLFLDLALEDLSHAADLLQPVFDQTDGVDGWVSFGVSPLIAHDTDCIHDAALDLYARLQRPNFFVEIPGTKDGLPAVEESIFAGVPVNVTLLFSWTQYLEAAAAFLRGIERRTAAGLKPNVASVASMSVCHWDAAVASKVPEELHNQLGVAVARRTYKAYRELLNSPRWQRACKAAVQPQRLLWTGLEISGADISEDFYIKALAAPFTIVSTSESNLQAFLHRGEIGKLMAEDGGDCEAVLARFADAGIDIDSLAFELQKEEAASAVKNWIDLMSGLASKSAVLWHSA
jgi:transaldolase